MTRRTTLCISAAAGAGILALVLTLGAPASQAEEEKKIDVKLCDNHTTVAVPKSAEEKPTRESALAISEALMAQWQRAHPDQNWVAEELERHTLVEPADNTGLVGMGQGSTYGLITNEDVLVWKRETVKFAVEGSRIFHSGDELGSTIAVSCDMCHPHAANTHPETYPKFQAQLGRVALLRDMINWCLEHPVRAKQLAADDPKMRALEAYILAQRKGKPLDYGRR